MKSRYVVLSILLLVVACWFFIGFWNLSNHQGDGSPLNDSETTPAENTDDEQMPDAGSDIEANPDSTPEPPGESEAELSNRRDIMLMEAERLYQGYFYEEALELLREDDTLFNDETIYLEGIILDAQSSLTLYTGEVKHIFFHTLILYPEYLYRNITTPQDGYAYFLYKRELDRALPLLLERGYVLYNINDLFVKDADGNMQRRDIYLPPEKMPLILSIDDPGYENAASHGRIGFANKLVLDENGDVATEVKTPEGEVLITYDGDVFLIVDNFVREHPEFSWRGAKGIIAATGVIANKSSHGLFGYDFVNDPSSRETVKAIADRIKENGWLFASHSFTHTVSVLRTRTHYDTERWKTIHGPLLGETNIFIAPAGVMLSGAALQVIIDSGFDIYCTVDTRMQIERVGSPIIVMGRLEISWYSLVRFRDLLYRDFFDATLVIDAHRPPLSLS